MAITRWARKITEAGGSLKDVQVMAGHADLATTQGYIEVNKNAAQGGEPVTVRCWAWCAMTEVQGSMRHFRLATNALEFLISPATSRREYMALSAPGPFTLHQSRWTNHMRKLLSFVSALALIGSVAAASAQAVPPNFATNGSFAEGYNTYRVAPASAYAKAPARKPLSRHR
jgi:hypothetical protein